MKKEQTFPILALVIMAFALILLLPNASAAINPEDPLGIGINPGDIPQTPEDAAKISLTYLKQEWTKIIAKNEYIGPTHNFFLANPTIFIVLFNAKYEFSLTFIFIFILWIFLAIVFGKIINSLGLLKAGLSWVFGALCSVILAQIGLIKLITDSTLNLIFLQSLWWMRALIWFIVVIVLIIIFYISQLTSQTIKQSKKKGKEQELEEESRKGKAFREGVEEGRKLSED